ncbi:MAG: phosphatidylglycerol lysyltransferase domain-containing protein [Bacteroidetes bacterium]|nr:phosphatidylglycerol lysyltransferase domain-containing protein [Bacteroidota bacterium]
MSRLLSKIHWKEMLALLFILLGIYFFRHEREELKALSPYLRAAAPLWISIGLLVTGVYIFLQSALFVYSFQAIGARLHWPAALLLFLKRNFISTFLPGGGVMALAYLPAMLRKEQLERHTIFQGAGMQGFIGILSLVLVGIPVILYSLVSKGSVSGAVPALATAIGLLLLLVWAFRSFAQRGWLYRTLLRYFPKWEQDMEALFTLQLSYRGFALATLSSIGIELTGIVHLFIAMKAAGEPALIEAALMGYVVSTLFLLISPFLKGLGAVELSLAYILNRYGYDSVAALEITILYRLFEFWLPLLAGLIAWGWKGKNIFLRILPPTLIFLLGAVNIFSVLTPPITARLHLLREYLPRESIHASNWTVILIGLVLIVNAAYLFRGLRSAWWIAVVFTILSLFGHIAKGLDYEEAILSFSILGVLIATRRQYLQHSSIRFMRLGLITALAAFLTVLLFGTIGFYSLDKKIFGIDFGWQDSIKFALHQFLLIDDGLLKPVNRFGQDFLTSLKVLASGAWLFLFYSIIRPYFLQTEANKSDQEKALYLLNQYGSSPVDYFKSDIDKRFFFPEGMDAFIAFKTAGGFAVVLDEPVCEEKDKIPAIEAFETQCRKWGLKPAYYRIDEDAWYYFENRKKKKLLIGQEAILSLDQFTLEGKQNKSLRNGLNSLQKKGYQVSTVTAPLHPDFVAALQLVSNEWLAAFDKTEMRFSQGVFDPEIIKTNDIICLRDGEGKLQAFLNVIPDYAPGECTYDLIRKTPDAPGGAMDALLVELIRYAKEKGYAYLNLGMVPMSGIDQPDNTAERVVKYAYEKIKRFRHYQGLREFKEKYADEWQNKYLVYENDFDLVQLPAALNKVMQDNTA